MATWKGKSKAQAPAKSPGVRKKAEPEARSPEGEDKEQPKRKSPAQEKLDAYGIDQLCTDITDGKTLSEIAETLEVSFGSLSAWIESVVERSARAREARQRAARLWDEQALKGLNDATDAFQLSKAREAAHHLRWRAAKIAPREYGDKLGIGAAPDLPPLPQPHAAPAVSVTFEVPPAEAYADMLRRKG